MDRKRQHWMTTCSLSCFILAAALMITSLDTSKRSDGFDADIGANLDASDSLTRVPIELVFSP